MRGTSSVTLARGWSITDADHADLFTRIRADCPRWTRCSWSRDPEPDGLSAYVAEAIALEELVARVERDDVTNVYYTSGTTGVPKGCMVGHEYWLRFVDLFQRLYGMGPQDRLLCCLQFFYNDPPWHTLLSLTAGTPLVVMRRFSVSRFWDVVRDNDVTIVFGIASTANLLLKAPPNPADRATPGSLRAARRHPHGPPCSARRAVGRAVGRGLRPHRDGAGHEHAPRPGRGHDRQRIDRPAGSRGRRHRGRR